MAVPQRPERLERPPARDSQQETTGEQLGLLHRNPIVVGRLPYNPDPNVSDFENSEAALNFMLGE